MTKTKECLRFGWPDFEAFAGLSFVLKQVMTQKLPQKRALQFCAREQEQFVSVQQPVHLFGCTVRLNTDGQQQGAGAEVVKTSSIIH